MTELLAEAEIPQQHKLMLNALVREVPKKLDRIFSLDKLPDEKSGACTTYSRMLAEVLGEFSVRAEVRPVYVITVNKAAIEYLQGRMERNAAMAEGAKMQIWGEIEDGQQYQHAVCYIADWNVIVDLGMATRGSKLVPSHPYWALDKFPWWVHSFEFKDYSLEYQGYETYPEGVKRAKEAIRKIVKDFILV